MSLFFLDVGWVEGFLLEHDELPLHGVEHVELDLIYFMFGLGVDEEVLVVEEGIDQQIWTILDVEDLASRWLDEHILWHIPLALPQQHPAMQSFAQIQVRSQLIRLIIFNSQCLMSQFLLHSLLVLDHRLVK